MRDFAESSLDLCNLIVQRTYRMYANRRALSAEMHITAKNVRLARVVALKKILQFKSLLDENIEVLDKQGLFS